MMKDRLILIFLITSIILSTQCTKVYVFTHNQQFNQILSDLEIPKYDSLNLIIEYRLWDIGEFGVTKLYRYYLTKDSIWIGEKYTRYKAIRRPNIPIKFTTPASRRWNKNITSWTKKEKKLNNRWALKFDKLNTIPSFDFKSDTLPIIINNGGLIFEKYHKGIKIATYEWGEAEILHKQYKNNIELKTIVEIIKMLEKGI
jgi:hypothetical protein